MGKSQHAIFPIQCGPVFLGVTTTLGRVLVRGPLSLSLLDVFLDTYRKKREFNIFYICF